jgi:DNA helicase-2/ATP-dependent DNA helicase PcrA
MESYLNQLNDAQKDAAITVDGPILILAGAGSGKTKTITTRLAYLLSIGIDPSNTLTLTFTNKAASEMRHRAMGMIENPIYPPLLCTFHKFGLLFLKTHIEKLGRKNSFVVIDTDDKKKILKEFADDLPVTEISSEISKFKNSLIHPAQAIEESATYSTSDSFGKRRQKIALAFEKYQANLIQKNLVDFDDLLALTYQILVAFPDVALETSKRYHYIMVDEYQDTNTLQYKLLNKLASTHNNLCVVGDDDQSIYSWRGANINNILDFQNEYENTKVVKLEKNYRSTPQILNAANQLIEHNRERLGKKLLSTCEEGKDIITLSSNDENEESRKIASSIKTLLSQGVQPSDIAVLFRINALSRSIEEGLTLQGIPFQVIGSLRFYERTEIKDAICYMRLMVNPHDDFSLKRIINKPKRGLGKVTLDKIEVASHSLGLSMYGYLSTLQDDGLQSTFGKKSGTELIHFVSLITSLVELSHCPPYSLIDEFEDLVKVRRYYDDLKVEQERVQNIDEFYGLWREFVKNNPGESIDEFLNSISLQSDQDTVTDQAVSIMSVHAAKGLEFSYLFVIGLEEGFFPLIGDTTDIEEERRLGYVALTRAKKELTLSYVRSRFYRGKRTELLKSRFLKEAGAIEGSLLIQKSSHYNKGDLVQHKIFGMGRITNVAKAGKDQKLTINFGGISRDILANFVTKI